MRTRLGGLVALLASVAATAGAHAAVPTAGAEFSVHDHATPGDAWHVEAKVNRRSDRLKSLVIASERCGDHTPFAQSVPIDAEGRVYVNGNLDPARPEHGVWGLDATFTSSHRLDGTFRFVTPDCDTGPMPFVAHSGGHDHHHDRTSQYGTPIGQMPDLSAAKPRRLAQALGLVRRTHRVAARRFPSYRDAIRAGYRRYSTKNSPRQLFHVRHEGYLYDGLWFRARRVESLVYYRPSVGEPVLLAFMYRARLGRHPRFGRPLLGWHSHGAPKPGRLDTQMTHVWLTGEDRSALANCLPVAQLEAAIPAFRMEPRSTGIGHESGRCPPDA